MAPISNVDCCGNTKTHAIHTTHTRPQHPSAMQHPLYFLITCTFSQWQPEHASQTPAAAEDRALYWAQSRLARRHDARQRQREGLNHVPSDAIIPARPWGRYGTVR